jgi:hypothetical protein
MDGWGPPERSLTSVHKLNPPHPVVIRFCSVYKYYYIVMVTRKIEYKTVVIIINFAVHRP